MFYLTKKSKIMIPILLMKNNESILLLFCRIYFPFIYKIGRAGTIYFISSRAGSNFITLKV